MTSAPVSPSTVNSGGRGNVRKRDRSVASMAIAAIWLFPVFAFTAPREATATGWEPFDTVKLLLLMGLTAASAWTLLRASGEHRYWPTLKLMVGFVPFVGWSIASVLWSPLKSVTIGQSGFLCLQIMIMMLVALACRDRTEVVRIASHLAFAFAACGCLIAVAYLFDPVLSGLDRSRLHAGGDGLLHPTAAGATASLGLVLFVLLGAVSDAAWTNRPWLALPIVAAHVVVLIASGSRTALVMTVVVLTPVLWVRSRPAGRAVTLALVAVVSLGLILVDPGFSSVGKTGQATANLVTRGQSLDQIRGLSGRGELWGTIWREFRSAPLTGHGYAVTSRFGEIEVWQQRVNLDAHNVPLHILATTGLIGLGLFAIAVAVPITIALTFSATDVGGRTAWSIFTASAVWYAGWGVFSSAMVGPPRPESLFFFVAIGMLVGVSSVIRTDRSP